MNNLAERSLRMTSIMLVLVAGLAPNSIPMKTGSNRYPRTDSGIIELPPKSESRAAIVKVLVAVPTERARHAR